MLSSRPLLFFRSYFDSGKILPLKKDNIPKEITAASKNNYDIGRKLPLSIFPYCGMSEDYQFGFFNCAGGHFKMSVTLSHIVNDLLKKFPDKIFYGLDLGCGRGNVIANINKKFPRMNFIGITAENPEEKNLPDCVLQGNIEEMTNLPKIKNRKFDLIVSSQTMFYLCNPLKTIYESYQMLADGGFLFIDNLNLVDLNKTEENAGEALMRYLANAGHDIIWGINKSTSKNSPSNWGPGWIFLKKNARLNLEFPLEYASILLRPQFIGENSIELKVPRLRYQPTKALLKTIHQIKTASVAEREEAIIGHLIKWGMTSSILKKTYLQDQHSVSEPYAEDFDFSSLFSDEVSSCTKRM